jgi:hypothetical protein
MISNEGIHFWKMKGYEYFLPLAFAANKKSGQSPLLVG